MKTPVVIATTLGFLAGAALSQFLNRQALAAADIQVNAALTAVARANAEIEALQACHPANTKTPIWAARQGGILHD